MKNSGLNYALWLLSRRDRSIGEIEKKLKDKEFSSEEIKETISFLLDKKFLNDERFAQNFIANQILIKPQGKYQLRIKLKKKLIPEEIIEKTLTEKSVNQKELVEEAAKKWLLGKYQSLNKRYRGDKNKLKNSLSRHLISRGFEYEDIKEVVNKVIL